MVPAVDPSSKALLTLEGRSLCHRMARGNWCENVGREAAESSLDAANLFIDDIVGVWGNILCLLIRRYLAV